MFAWLNRFLMRARATVSRQRDREIRDELRLHLDLLEEDYRAEGVAPDEARRRARRDFGNAATFQEASHDTFVFRPVEDLAQDIRQAVREMRRSPGFTGAAVLSLALGIGAVSAAFVVVDAFMLRPLAIHDPGRLVAVSPSDASDWGSWPYALYVRWHHALTGVADLAASSDSMPFDLPQPGDHDAREVRVSFVSPNYLQVIGTSIALGTNFTGTDSAGPAGARIAVISDAFWRRQFGRAGDVLSKTLALHGVPVRIVGVTVAGFTGHEVGHACDIWVPLELQPGLLPEAPRLLEDRWGTKWQWLKLIGRLDPRADARQAAARANVAFQDFVADKAAAIGASHPQVVHQRQQTVTVVRAATGDAPRGRFTKPLVMLLGLTTLVLLMACTNFTGLIVARGQRRRSEFVLRSALGCGRGRLLRQALTECVVLGVLGGAAGLLVAQVAIDLFLTRVAATMMPIALVLRVDAHVVTFATACSALAIAFGVVPSVQAARVASSGLIPLGRGETGDAGPRVVGRRALLVAQMTICTVLLVGTGLLLRSVVNLRTQPIGFDRDVLVASAAARQPDGSAEAAAVLVQQITSTLASVSGIQAVGLSGSALLDSAEYWIDNSQVLTTDAGLVLPGAHWTSASAGPLFFKAVGLRILAGHSFDALGQAAPVNVVVINESLATFLFRGEGAIGRRLREQPRGPMETVIGVVSDAKQTSPRDRGLGIIYHPLRDLRHVVIAIRMNSASNTGRAAVARELESARADLRIGPLHTMADVLDDAIAQERVMSDVSMLLGVLVVTVAWFGLYSVMAYEVSQRTRELGVRLALGATGRSLAWIVLRDSLFIVVPALAVGMPLGVAAGRLLATQLYDVRADDVSTLVAVACLVTGVGLLAAVGPARMASRLDPMVLLRHE